MNSTPASSPQPSLRSALRTIVLVFVGVFVVLGLFVFAGSTGGRRAPRVPDRISAWVDCKAFVTNNLKSPSTAVFPASNQSGVTIIQRRDNGWWSVVGYVDAQNAFGAMIREEFGCQLSYDGETATLQGLRIGDKVLLE